MELYLVQHGLSKSKDVDPERSLTEIGERLIGEIAELAKKYKVSPKQIHHSTKKRAKQTAHILAEKLQSQVTIEELNGLAPMDDVEKYWLSVEAPDGLMVVGHLPFMDKLAALLVSGDCEKSVIKFTNGAINKLVSEDGKKWSVEAILPPIC